MSDVVRYFSVENMNDLAVDMNDKQKTFLVSKNDIGFYSDIKVTKGRTSNTDYYICVIPYLDSNNDSIDLYVGYDAEKNPLQYADASHTSVTVNGNASALVSGNYVYGISIGNGVVLSSNSLYNQVPNSMLYIGLEDDRTIHEYLMNSEITAEQMLSDGCNNVFNCYFKLVNNSELVDLTNISINGTAITSTERNPLLVMGIKSNKDLVFIACDGRTDINEGLTYAEIGNLLIAQGCSTGYNLDGGGSTCMVINGSKINRNIDDEGTTIRNIHYSLNVKKDSDNLQVQSAYSKIGLEKQNLIEQIIPYINEVASSNPSELGTAISSGSDLNNLIYKNKYYCASAAIAASLSNSPVNYSGFDLYNVLQGSSGRVWTQIIIANTTSTDTQYIYYRQVNRNADGSLGTVYTWKRLAVSTEVSSDEFAVTAPTGVTMTRFRCYKQGHIVTVNGVLILANQIAKNNRLLDLPESARPVDSSDIFLMGSDGTAYWAQVIKATGSQYINVVVKDMPADTYRINAVWRTE